MQLRRIAAIDDQPRSVAMFAEAISQYLDAEPVEFDRLPATPTSVAEWVTDERIDAVLIDQDLLKGNYGASTGIAIAAELFKQNTPTVLTTMHRMADIHDAIWYRRYLPAYLPKKNMVGLEAAMNRALAETGGRVPDERKAFRTVVRVDEVQGGEVSLIIPAFDAQEWIPVSWNELGKRLGKDPAAGMRFMAEVNIGAPSQDELFISEIEP
jgi:hypothetical protein